MSQKRKKDNQGAPQNKKTGNSFEKDFINFITVSSLENISIIQICIMLWKHLDIRDRLKQHISKFNGYRISFGSSAENSFNELEEMVLKKLSQISMTYKLKVKISNIVRPIGLQILKFMNYDCSSMCLDDIYWTSEGTIDETKTKEILMEDRYEKEYILYRVSNLYDEACDCCLDELIPKIWTKMSKRQQECYIKKRKECSLVAYWTNTVHKNKIARSLELMFARCSLPNVSSKSDDGDADVHEKMFTLSASNGNVVATKYFWNKLTYSQKYSNRGTLIASIIEEIDKDFIYQNANDFMDIICFLLSHMNDIGQQFEILSKHSEQIIIALFRIWPWQRFLLPTLRMVWNFVDGPTYVEFISDVVKEIKENRTTQYLLREVWCESPINLKKCYFRYIIKKSRNIFWKLLDVKDVDTVKVLLNDADIEEKKRIMFSAAVDGNELFKLILKDEFALIGKLVEETLTLESDVNEVKREIMLQTGDRLLHDWICAGNWQAVDNLIIWGFNSLDQFNNFKKNKIICSEIFKSLVLLGNYTLVDKFMRWYYSTAEEIIQFKKEFVNDRNSEYTCRPVSELLLKLSSEEDGWNLFEKFLKYSFSSNDEINDFKKESKQSVFEFLNCKNFEFAKKFLAWCLDSDKKIIDFKNELMFSTEGIELFLIAVSEEFVDWEKVKNIMKLCSPFTKDSVLKLRNCLKDSGYLRGPAVHVYLQDREKTLFNFLDNLITEGCLSENESESSNDYITFLCDDVINSDENITVHCDDNSEEEYDDTSNESCSDEDSIYSDSDPMINSYMANVIGGLMCIDSDNTTDSDDNCDSSYEYEEDVVLLLLEIVNEISNNLQLSHSTED